MEFSKRNLIDAEKNVVYRFHSIEEERRAEFIEALTVIVFFAPEEYSLKK